VPGGRDRRDSRSPRFRSVDDEGFMNAKDAILSVYNSSATILEKYLGDLSDADLLVRPGPGQNHIAWQLGHLIVSERYMLESIKPGSSPELPAGFAEAHGRDEASTASDDPARFATKAAYLDLMKAQREASKTVLDVLSESDLDAPSSEPLRNRFPTVGSVMLLIGTHGIMHSGQFVTVRRKLNKPVVI
jgi:hypothetical protein